MDRQLALRLAEGCGVLAGEGVEKMEDASCGCDQEGEGRSQGDPEGFGMVRAPILLVCIFGCEAVILFLAI